MGTFKTDRLDYVSARRFDDGVPRDEFGLVAEGTTKIPRAITCFV